MGWLNFKLRQASWSWDSRSELEISEQLGKYDKKPTSPCSVRSRVQIIIKWMNILVGSGCHETWGPYRHEGKLPKISLMFRFPNPTNIYCFRFLHLYTSRENFLNIMWHCYAKVQELSYHLHFTPCLSFF